MDVDVSPSDIEIELGRTLSSIEVEQVGLWTGDAARLIESRLPGADLNADTVAMVVRLAVAKRLRESGQGEASSTTVSVDDATVTRRFGEYTRGGDGAWWFLPDWWLWLSPSTTALSSVRPGFEPDVVTDSSWA